MSDVTCKQCGYKTFSAYALKDDKGRLICPQCREPYLENPPAPVKMFKFKSKNDMPMAELIDGGAIKYLDCPKCGGIVTVSQYGVRYNSGDMIQCKNCNDWIKIFNPENLDI
jgi:transcription elongation factor Elf1